MYRDKGKTAVHNAVRYRKKTHASNVSHFDLYTLSEYFESCTPGYLPMGREKAMYYFRTLQAFIVQFHVVILTSYITYSLQNWLTPKLDNKGTRCQGVYTRHYPAFDFSTVRARSAPIDVLDLNRIFFWLLFEGISALLLQENIFKSFLIYYSILRTKGEIYRRSNR